jgi:hypothetical protein
MTMARTIDYGHYIDQTSFEHQLTKELEQLTNWICQVTDMETPEALGYPSWTAYLAETLGDEPMRLARDERQEMVKVLSAEGMSNRAIAPIVGASEPTVRRDVQAGASFDAPQPKSDAELIVVDRPAAYGANHDGWIQDAFETFTYATPWAEDA